MNTHKNFELLKQKIHELQVISATIHLLDWDQQTKMPKKNAAFRAEQTSYLETLYHEKFTNPQFVDLVEALSNESSKLDAVAKRSVAVVKRDLDKKRNLPAKFVEKFSKEKSEAHHAWLDAKESNDFGKFKPSLERIIAFTKEYAGLVDDSKPLYDVLLDDYEEGITTEQVSAVFSKLKEGLEEILSRRQSKVSLGTFSKIPYDKPTVEQFLKDITAQIGFDYSRGALGEVHHPFADQFSPDDIRINASYYHKDLSSSITGAIHELGHGLYEQFVDPKYRDTYLATGVSLGVHESQSRLLENMIGRSEPMWHWMQKKLAEYFPEAKGIRPEDFVHDLTTMEPTFIRIEADEVTYNLHIILRFEIEQEMLKDDFDLETLPELWNQKMKDLLGIIPPEFSKGVLQDVHWSLGAIGYFPTYSLGNIIAGQLWEKFEDAHPRWDENISQGDFSDYFSWFKENIWQHGSFYKPMELVTNVTGEKLNPNKLIEYLKDRYLINN